MKYNVRLSSRAQADFETIPEADQKRLCKAIASLADNPFPPDSRDLSTVGTLPGMPMAELERWLQLIRDSEYISTRQAAEEFVIPPATLRYRARCRKLLVQKVGREWRFNRGELQVLAHGGQELMDEVDDLAFLKYLESLPDDNDEAAIPWEEVERQLGLSEEDSTEPEKMSP